MKRARTTKVGKVEKVIEAVVPNEKDKAEIHIQSAEPLYQEIRIDNELMDCEGETLELKPEPTLKYPSRQSGAARSEVVLFTDAAYQRRLKRCGRASTLKITRALA